MVFIFRSGSHLFKNSANCHIWTVPWSGFTSVIFLSEDKSLRQPTSRTLYRVDEKGNCTHTITFVCLDYPYNILSMILFMILVMRFSTILNRSLWLKPGLHDSRKYLGKRVPSLHHRIKGLIALMSTDDFHFKESKADGCFRSVTLLTVPGHRPYL